MKGRSLDREMSAALSSIRNEHIERLVSLGPTISAIAALGMRQAQFGVANVRMLLGGLYEPDPDGDPAVIMPVCTDDRELGDSGIIDLITWRTSNPDRWFWRIGTGWALGTDLLDGESPVKVVARPIDWLSEAGNALCILDWAAPASCWARVRAGPPLHFTDDVLRQKVCNALVHSFALPTMEMTGAA